MRKRMISVCVAIMFACCVAMPPGGYAQVLPLPEGGVFVNGDGTISVNGQVMNINQMSQQAIIEWLSFCIAQGYTVNFNMPNANSIVLNQITGLDPSVVFGNLIANGQVFLVNPNGILFAPSAYVNAPGLVASTLSISNEDFLNGNYVFQGVGGSVINQGLLTAPGGYVALLGNSVQNSGLIVSQLGTVALASGDKVTLGLDPQGLISVVVNEAATQNTTGAISAVSNTGTISANGGTVIMTANALNGLFNNAINNEGVIEAQSLLGSEGQVFLTAGGENSVVSNTGTIDVSPAEAGAEGGFIELSGGELNVTPGSLLTGETGEVLFDPWNIYLGDIWEAILQALSGSATLSARNNIYLNLGNIWGDDILDLFNFGAGDTFTMMAGNDIYLNNDSIVTAGGNMVLLADAAADYGLPWGWVPSDGVGTIYMGTGAGLQSNGGNITLVGAGIDLSALVNAGSGNVLIDTEGDILDNHSGVDIIANNLEIFGQSIGVGDAVDTDINSLTAAAIGDVAIADGGSFWAQSVASVSGNIDLSASNDLTIGLVSGTDRIELTAGNNIEMPDGSLVTTLMTLGSFVWLTAGHDIRLFGNATIDSDLIYAEALGNISLRDTAQMNALAAVALHADDDINMSGDSLISAETLTWLAAGNNINLEENAIVKSNGWLTYLGAQNSLNMSGNSWVSAAGTAYLFGTNNVLLGRVEGDSVSVRTDNGSIIDNNGSATNILANTANLRADNGGIGALDAIETDINQLVATASGDISIKDAGSFLAQNVNSLAGNVSLSAVHDMEIGLVSAGGSFARLKAGNNILMQNGSQATALNLDLMAGNDFIMQDNALISGDFLYLSTGNDFRMSDDAMIDMMTLALINSGHDIRLSGNANVISDYWSLLWANNDIVMSDNASVGSAALSFLFASDNVDMSGNASVVSGDSVSIIGRNDVLLGLASGNSVYVRSMDGSITDNNGSALNIIANNATLRALSGSIGAGDAIDTDINSLVALANGDIAIDDIGSFIAQNVWSLNGNIYLSALNDLTIGTVTGTKYIDLEAGNDIVLPDGSLITTLGTGGSFVELNAGNDIRLEGNALIDSDWIYAWANGDISLSDTAQMTTLTVILLRAMRNINMSGNSSLSSGNLVWIRAKNDVNLSGSAAISAATTALLIAENDFNMNDSSLVTTLGSSVVIGQNNVRLGRVEGSDVYVRTIMGSITDNNGSAANIIANTADLQAGADIGAGDAIDLDVNFLSANAGGNINVAEKDGALFSNIFAGGAIDILANGASTLGDITGGGFVNFENTIGDVTFDGTVTSTGSGVGITVDNGSVFVTSTGPHMVANGDSFIDVGLGKITPSGTPLNVNINGNLYMNLANLPILAPDGAVYGNITGTITSPFGIPILMPTSFPSPLNPPGFVYYNGIQIWPPKGNSNVYAQFAALGFEGLKKAYWEVLSPYRYVSTDPATRTFYLYHPLTETDESAFEGIAPSEDAYEFIEDNIRMKKELNPYFGWLENTKSEEVS